jgi:ankyrin repeat and LEM domain-containing protein 2
MEERSNNLLDAMLNTPDKIENNTPLHYACKFGNVEIVETLLNFKICNRESVNKLAKILCSSDTSTSL